MDQTDRRCTLDRVPLFRRAVSLEVGSGIRNCFRCRIRSNCESGENAGYQDGAAIRPTGRFVGVVAARLCAIGDSGRIRVEGRQQ